MTAQADARFTDLQRAMKACRSSLFLVFIYSCGYNLLLLAPSLYLLQIYDRVLASRSVDTLLMLTLVAAAAVVVNGLLDSLRRAALSRIGFWLEDRLRPSVFAAAFDFARLRDPSTAAEACRDLSTIRQFMASPACAVLFDVPWAVVFFVVLFLVHPLLGTIGAAAAVLMLACALANEFFTRPALNRAHTAEAGTNHRLTAALRNVQAIRAMGMLEGTFRLVQRDVASAREAQLSAARRGEAFQGFSKGARSLVQVVIMGAAAWLVLHYHVSAGIIFVSSLLLGRGLAPIEGVIGGWKSWSSARFSYRRLTELLATGEADGTAEAFGLPEPEGLLTVDGLTYVPPGSNALVLQGISFSVAPGECVGIIGPSGAGKTTLARIIMGISKPTMGRVRLDGADISQWLQADGAKHLGYLPQEVELFEGSIKDNIARLRDADTEDVVQAAQLVGLHNAIMQLPRGYDTLIGEGGFRLSGGQRQCLGLARAFFGSPHLVVLDEPNANLDDYGEKALYRAVERMKASGTSIIIITHRLGILNTADKIAVMGGGTIKAFGSAQEIYNKFFRKPDTADRESAPPQNAQSEQTEVTPPATSVDRLPMGSSS